jgi:hypothetical protein
MELEIWSTCPSLQTSQTDLTPNHAYSVVAIRDNSVTSDWPRKHTAAPMS